MVQGQLAPGEVGAGILLAFGGYVAVGQHLGGGNVVAIDQIPGQSAEGGDLGPGIGLPAPLVSGQGFVFRGITQIDYLDAEGAGIEPGILMPAAATGVPGALAVGHQLVDGKRPLVGVAGDQVVGTHLVLGFGQQAQGAGVVLVGVVEDQKSDALILVGADMVGGELIRRRLAGAKPQQQTE
ncbi:hypothetical protein D3C76_982430 [compost metagenome]